MTTVLVIILWILAILLLANGCIGIFLLKTQDSKSEQKNKSQSVDKPKVMKKTNNNQGSKSSSSGFANTMSLTLIISLIYGVLFMIIYMLIK